MERPIGQTLLGLAVTLAAIPLLLQVFTKALERPYTIYVDANSEILRLTTRELNSTTWYLPNARIVQRIAEVEKQTSDTQSLPKPTRGDASKMGSELIEIDFNTPEPKINHFHGYLHIGPNAIVTMTRRGAGPLVVTIESNASSQRSFNNMIPAATMEPLDCINDGDAMLDTTGKSACTSDEISDDQKRLTKPLALHQAKLLVDIGDAPLNGTLNGIGTIGGDPYQPTMPASPPLLRHGEISIIGRKLISGQVYTLMQTTLHLGDTVNVNGQFEPDSQKNALDQSSATALFTCLFSVQNGSMGGRGIELACHASGRSLDIGSYSDSSRRDLAPRPWDVLINEPSMQATLPLAITGFFVLVLRLLDSLYPRLCRWIGDTVARLR
ncbi:MULTISPECIES: hypothetical protein [unclassified Modicisalibacter]|uniref:hypothetical protein n=1 Tax=unclassified Modicisalibacter TaxID=2679913 RepID=UPI001CCA0474|nr:MULTISPECIES: hypothetical protein [unclassified Modicisalibacter]MBZ9556917.1 hypothetical protein [Modicisalibacter sp. R2A 31.J]MBZ9574370.1 hypothetical protein [Modicisalibacter sp. MOD 31.J]